MRTRYRIDSYQASYFVIQSFEQLFEATEQEFTPIYRVLKPLPLIDAGEVLAAEATFRV